MCRLLLLVYSLFSYSHYPFSIKRSYLLRLLRGRLLARPGRFERSTYCLEGSCSILLSYGRIKKLSGIYAIDYTMFLSGMSSFKKYILQGTPVFFGVLLILATRSLFGLLAVPRHDQGSKDHTVHHRYGQNRDHTF